MKKDEENILYGEALRKIRKANNLTQEEVAQQIGVDTKYISQIECGVAKGTISTMLKFCKAYNVTPNDILCTFIKDLGLDYDLKQFETRFSKLNKRDKKIVLSLIENLIEL